MEEEERIIQETRSPCKETCTSRAAGSAFYLFFYFFILRSYRQDDDLSFPAAVRK